MNPTFYPHPVETIDMLQTHISWVFLTGDYAYKVKKPVNFGFLDFSSLEKRQHYCHEELRLNRRLAPEIYLDVLSVGMTKQGPKLGGSDNVVDYCLKMRQFDQKDLLSNRLEYGRFESGWMDSIAEDIARFHAGLADEASHTHGSPDVLFAHIRDNLEVARTHTGDGIDPEVLARIRGFTDSASRYRPLLAGRQQAGHIRPCHGDLHLRNIALVSGRPRAFDCIEFNEAYRVIDTMNDIAFLVMDCEARKRTDLGMRFLSRYLEVGGDYAGLNLLQLYLFYRATVRGKVACLLAGEMSDETMQATQFKEARHYFSLAAVYLSPPASRLFMIGGLSGSGKSHLARIGAGIERAIVIRSDATRKRIAAGEPSLPLYGTVMNRLTYEAMMEAADSALKAGWPVILDATFMQAEQRQNARQLAIHCSVPFHAYWLEADIETMRQRIRRRLSKAKDVSDADLDILDQQLASYQRPTDDGVFFLADSGHWPEIKR